MIKLCRHSSILRISGYLLNSPTSPTYASHRNCFTRKYNLPLDNELPADRVKRLIKGEFETYKDGRFTPVSFPEEVDILIIGGGVIGSSVAYWLNHKAPDSFSVMVVERDKTYARSSTTLSAGGIRQQFSLAENIQLSMASAEFLRNVRKNLSVVDHDPPDIQFNPCGYLLLATDSGAEQLEENYRLQCDLGASVQLLSPTMIKEHFPWMNIDGIALGTLGMENEGWFDPWSLLYALKRKVLSFGTPYVEGEVIDFELKASDFVVGDQLLEHPTSAIIRLPDGTLKRVKFCNAIIACGAHSQVLTNRLKIGLAPGFMSVPLPVEPRKRYVYTFHCPDGPGIEFPFLVDSSGSYCRREGIGGHYICGKSPPEDHEPDTKNLDVDYEPFEETVWPDLAKRVPAFENIKLRSAWAGYYDYNTVDQNGIVGRHPILSSIILATGFSGHGIQMAPAVGRAVSELIIYNEYKTIDLKRFGFERILNNEPLLESGII